MVECLRKVEGETTRGIKGKFENFNITSTTRSTEEQRSHLNFPALSFASKTSAEVHYLYPGLVP